MYGFLFLFSNFFFGFSRSFSLEVRLSFLRFNACIQSFFFNLKIRALQAFLVLQINQTENHLSKSQIPFSKEHMVTRGSTPQACILHVTCIPTSDQIKHTPALVVISQGHYHLNVAVPSIGPKLLPLPLVSITRFALPFIFPSPLVVFICDCSQRMHARCLPPPPPLTYSPSLLFNRYAAINDDK